MTLFIASNERSFLIFLNVQPLIGSRDQVHRNIGKFEVHKMYSKKKRQKKMFNESTRKKNNL